MDHYMVRVKVSFIKKPNTKKNKNEIKVLYSLYMNKGETSFTIKLAARDYYRAKKGKNWRWHGAMSKDDGSGLKDHGRDFTIYSHIGEMDESNSWVIPRKHFLELLDKFEGKLVSMCAHNCMELSSVEKETIRNTFLDAVKKKSPFIKLVIEGKEK